MISYRHLFTFEYPKYATFLKSLDEDTRRSFFGYTANDAAIDHLVTGFHSAAHKHEFIVATDAQPNWVGVVHIAHGGSVRTSQEAELGIIVKPENRRQGIGNELISRATLWARNRNYLDIYMHCISRNTAVMNLVKKHNLKIDMEYDEADARITLPAPTLKSLMSESTRINMDLMQAAFKLSTPWAA